MTLLETVLAVAVILLAVAVAVGFVVAIRILRQLGVGGLGGPVANRPELAGKPQRAKKTAARGARSESSSHPVDEARAAVAAARSDAAAAKAEAAAARTDARRILDSARAEADGVLDRAHKQADSDAEQARLGGSPGR